jgi:hypothetical protein
MDDVDLALILAIDCSASVGFDEFTLLSGGTASALREPDVAAGLIGGPAGASLLAVLLWSGIGAQEVLVEWTRVTSVAELEAFARQVEWVPRVVRAGATAIGEALQAAEAMLVVLPAAARRQVIDMVGDGRSNEGIRPTVVRDRLAAHGVTINGLCVLHDEPDLLDSYRAEVIGGPGAFVLQCQDFSGFADAMRQKLAREIAIAGRGGIA